jgi:hypothetical protein
MQQALAGGESRTIILWGRDDALGWSIEFFLKSHPGWEVQKVCREDGIAPLIEQVEKLKPSAVLVYGEDVSIMAPLMNVFPELKVINASLEDSTIEIYTKDSVSLKQVADLLAYIDGEPGRIQPEKGEEQGVE